MDNINCWEFLKCGREIGGSKINELGLCSAATDTSADGINGGVNGGRICWSTAGLFAKKIDCLIAKKTLSCINCDFFNMVNKQEGDAKFKFLI